MFGEKIDTLDYMTELCPKCHTVSPYKANPMYMHICDDCGFQGRKEDLITVYDDVQFEKDVTKAREEMKKHKGITLLSKLKEEKKKI